MSDVGSYASKTRLPNSSPNTPSCLRNDMEGEAESDHSHIRQSIATINSTNSILIQILLEVSYSSHDSKVHTLHKEAGYCQHTLQEAVYAKSTCSLPCDRCLMRSKYVEILAQRSFPIAGKTGINFQLESGRRGPQSLPHRHPNHSFTIQTI